jgi:hypothetical protein
MSFKLSIVLAIIGICSARQINDAGLQLIEKFEGFYPNFYNDPVVRVLLIFWILRIKLDLNVWLIKRIFDDL